MSRYQSIATGIEFGVLSQYKILVLLVHKNLYHLNIRFVLKYDSSNLWANPRRVENEFSFIDGV